MKIKLFLFFTIMLNSYSIYSQGDEYLDAEKLKMIFNYEPEEKVDEFIKVSTELQIKFKLEDDKILLLKNNKKCFLTADVFYYVLNEKKSDAIEKIDNSVTQWRVYYKLQSKIAVSLTKHIQAYNSRLMTTTRLITWKKDTKECLSVEEKMNKIPFANSRNFYFQLGTEENQVHSGILDIMNTSRNLLGI
ncbi:hypothetical protein ABF174_002300 [Flavobacterium psychrophilum]